MSAIQSPRKGPAAGRGQVSRLDPLGDRLQRIRDGQRLAIAACRAAPQVDARLEAQAAIRTGRHGTMPDKKRAFTASSSNHDDLSEAATALARSERDKEP
jgi:hypothetical protein